MKDLFEGAIFGGLVGIAIGSLGVLMINSRYEELTRENEALRSKVTNSIPFEERLSDGGKGYVLNLEGRVKPGDYILTTEESNGCNILSWDAKVNPGNYKLMFIETVKQLEQPSTFVPLEPYVTTPTLSSNPLRPEEKGNLPYAIPGTNKLDPTEAKRFGLPTEGYIVKPHPYKEGGFLIIKDSDSKKSEGSNKTSLKIVNPDGSVHYNVQVRDAKGNLLREYIEPSNRLEKNPDYKPGSDKPQFHSTTPVLTYPDGTIEGYRPPKDGGSLEDVIKESPIDKYVPKKYSSK